MTTTTKLTVDRIENGSIAVMEDEEGRLFPIPLHWLPGGVSEGDVVRVIAEDAEGGRIVRFLIDEAETEARQDEAAALRDSLRRAPKGDIEL